MAIGKVEDMTEITATRFRWTATGAGLAAAAIIALAVYLADDNCLRTILMMLMTRNIRKKERRESTGQKVENFVKDASRDAETQKDTPPDEAKENVV